MLASILGLSMARINAHWFVQVVGILAQSGSFFKYVCGECGGQWVEFLMQVFRDDSWRKLIRNSLNVELWIPLRASAKYHWAASSSRKSESRSSCREHPES